MPRNGSPTSRKRPPCPRCGQPTVPVVLGYPDSQLEAQAGRGEVVLGGCRIRGEELDPEWACLACREQYTRAQVGLPSRLRRK